MNAMAVVLERRVVSTAKMNLPAVTSPSSSLVAFFASKAKGSNGPRQTRLLDREPTVAVRGVAALDLHPDLCHLVRLRLVAWVGVDADDVVAFVVRRGLVRQDVPAHQMAHHQKLGTGGYDG